MEALIAALVLAAPGALVLRLHRRERRRRAGLAALAAERGWTWTPRDDEVLRGRAGEPFGRGRRRRATNVLRGTFEGREVLAFDCTWTTPVPDGHAVREVRSCAAVCLLRLPAAVPRLDIAPRTLRSRAAGTVSGGRVDLESEHFGRRWTVHAAERRFAYDVLHPRAVDALLRGPTLHLRLEGAEALTWERGLTAAETLPARLAALSGLVAGVPAYVWTDREDSA